MDSPVSAAWQRIESALDADGKETLQKWWGPALERDIVEAETKLGKAFPADLRESLLLHNPGRPIEALAVMGMANSLWEGLASALSYSNGPLQTRFSDGDTAYPGCDGEFGGMWHSSTYDQDRTYFYLVVDLHTSSVLYVDFGDLVSDVTGAVVARSFLAYLEAIAAALERPDPPLSWFPKPQFGFQGTDKILSLFPGCRELQLPQSASQFDGLAPIRSALRESIRNPVLKVFQAPRVSNLDALPPPPQPSARPQFITGPNVQMVNGKARTHSYNVHMLADLTVSFGTPSHLEPVYFEFALGAGTIYYVGLYWESSATRVVGVSHHVPVESLLLALESNFALHSQWNGPHGMTGSQRVFKRQEDGNRKLEEGDVVGCLVDESSKSVSFYLNRILLGQFQVELGADGWIRKAECGVNYKSDLMTVRPEMVFRPCLMGHTFEAQSL
jgi:hypothetical protein